MVEQRIAICTGGGDCAGINAALISAARYASTHYQAEVFFVQEGYDGLGHVPARITRFDPHARDLQYAFSEGGSMLGNNNQGSPFRDPKTKAQALAAILSSLKQANIKKILTIGGEGTHGMSQVLVEAGIQTVGIVKTIDNDMPFCDQTIGFSTAVANTVSVLETLRTTAQSLGRVFIVETMGRNSGFLTLHAGVAAQCDLIVLPEIAYDFKKIAKHLQAKGEALHPRDKGALILVSEGAKAINGQTNLVANASGKQVLGGVARKIAEQLNQEFHLQTRDFTIGYLSRGGAPNAEDRLLATEWAAKAVDQIFMDSKQSGVICYHQRKFEFKRFEDIPSGVQRKISADDPLLQYAIKQGLVFNT